MKNYIAIVRNDAGSAFGVEFPDLPGCFSAADDLDSIIPNACDALALYLDDTTAPAASSMEEILAAAHDDILGGAFLIAVPYIENDARPVRVNLSLDSGTLRAIDDAAAIRKLTRSAVVALAARNEIEVRT